MELERSARDADENSASCVETLCVARSRRLRRVVTAVAAQTFRAVPITNVRAKETGSDGVRTFDVVVGIRMKILPVLGKPSASRAVVGGTAVASGRGVTDVAKILVLCRAQIGRASCRGRV